MNCRYLVNSDKAPRKSLRRKGSESEHINTRDCARRSQSLTLSDRELEASGSFSQVHGQSFSTSSNF